MGTIGIALPNLPGVTPPLIPEFARRIEAGGCDAIWALDRLVYENPDPLTALAAAAAVTSRVRLGTSVLLAPLHSPVVLAKQLATLDLVSNGRLLVGLGIGSRPDDFAAAGVPFAGRGGPGAGGRTGSPGCGSGCARWWPPPGVPPTGSRTPAWPTLM